MSSLNEDAEYEVLMSALHGHATFELRFWLRALPVRVASRAWADAPRADWLYLIATRMGVPSAVLGQLKLHVKAHCDEVRVRLGAEYTPHQCCADRVRSGLGWAEVWRYHEGAQAPRRTS